MIKLKNKNTIMKVFILVLLIILLTILLFSNKEIIKISALESRFKVTVDQEEALGGPWRYIIEDEKVIILGYSNEYENEIIIPSSINPFPVISIAPNAFFEYKSAQTLVIEDGVEKIGEKAFYGCEGFTQINIPNSITTIEKNAFAECANLTDIYVNNYEANLELGENWSGSATVHYLHDEEVDGVTWVYTEDENGITIVRIKEETEIPNEITIPTTLGGNPVVSIGDEAFKDCREIEEVIIPEGITNIEDNAFKGCTSLEYISIPSSVTSIGDGAFENCSSLERINDISLYFVSDLTEIGANAFKGCTSLGYISIPSSVTSIGDGAFKNCTSMEYVYIDNAETSIGDGAFENCGEIKEANLGDGITRIGADAFLNCSKLERINYDNSLYLASDLTEIGANAFKGCESLEEIIIPISVVQIGDSAFMNCTNLSDIYVYNYENAIELGNDWSGDAEVHYMFEGTLGDYTETTVDGITWVYLRMGNEATNVHPKSKNNLPKSINIPETLDGYRVVSLSDEAFKDCTSLKNVYLNDGIVIIGKNAFDGCTSLEQINLENIGTIEDEAFKDCISLGNEIRLSDEIRKIGKRAFKGCISIEGFVDNSGYYNLKIEEETFAGCASLKNVYLNDGVGIIGKNAFDGCTSLEQINLENIRIIEDEAFKDCTSLGNEIRLSDEIRKIGKRAFKGCISIEGFAFDNRGYYNIKIEEETFAGCTSLKNVYLNAGVGIIGKNAFDGCTSLEQINLENIRIIEDEAFKDCTSLGYEIGLSNEIIKIGDRAFADCTRLAYIYVDNYESDLILGENWNGDAIVIFKDKVVEEIEIDVPEDDPTIQKVVVDNTTYIVVSPTVSMDELKEKIVTNVNKNKLVIEEKSNDIDYTEIEDNVLKTGVTIKYGNQIICTIIVKGDTNRDGVADIRDLLEINKHRLGKVLLTGESLLAGDINQDGQVDLHDLLQLNKYRLGKIDTL